MDYDYSEPPIQNERVSVNERRRALLIAALASFLLYVLWNVPALASVLYPLRLFVTFIHEAGHSLAALLTGGQIVEFIVSANGSGLATTIGGNRPLVISMGYLGAALFGSGLFFLANRFSRYDRVIAISLGIGVIVLTFSYAGLDENNLPVALLVGYGFGAALVGVGWKAPRVVTLLVLDVLAISTALNAVLDVWYLVGSLDASRGLVVNDAVALSQYYRGFFPAVMVALMWSVLAVGMFGTAVWYGVWQPLRQEVDAAFDRARRQ